MRFKLSKPKEVIIEPIKQPNIGDTKEEIKFAYWFKKIDHTTIIICEKYIEVYEFKMGLIYQYNPYSRRGFYKGTTN